MRLGIIQGRLSKPDNGFQDTPLNWETEFEDLSNLGLFHVEWIVTKQSFSNNPIFFSDVKGLPINSICADNVVSDMIYDRSFLEHNLIPICATAQKNDIKNITIPLLEDSSVEGLGVLKKFCASFAKICNSFKSLTFSLETELSIEKIPYLLDISDNIGLTYDTGNSTSYGVSHIDYIERFHNMITNVHIKDRTIDGNSVRPTLGDTDFNLIFSTLLKNGYCNPFTLQTMRERTGLEKQTILNHSKIIRRIYEQNK
jgi:L-ribulose-5-phosphate 3-epimerase